MSLHASGHLAYRRLDIPDIEELIGRGVRYGSHRANVRAWLDQQLPPGQPNQPIKSRCPGPSRAGRF
ncbi:MAG TPA: hypothetical protein VHF45_01285 [Thermoleophilaceae bacterium]|nr:hypothetical protein [Thermoleophilaceae bacterium]